MRVRSLLARIDGAHDGVVRSTLVKTGGGDGGQTLIDKFGIKVRIIPI